MTGQQFRDLMRLCKLFPDRGVHDLIGVAKSKPKDDSLTEYLDSDVKQIAVRMYLSPIDEWEGKTLRDVLADKICLSRLFWWARGW